MRARQGDQYRLGLVAVVTVLCAKSGSAPGPQVSPLPSPPGPPLSRQVAALEYRPSLHAGVLTAPNRANGLRLRWEEGGVRVEDRTKGTPLATLRTTGVGRAGSMQALALTAASQEGARVVRRWAGLTEWWVNEPRGVEHGWTVETRPPGEGPLVLRVAVGAAKVESAANAHGDGVVLTAGGGRPLAYGQLRVTDGTGQALSARLRPNESGVSVEVDDADAVYPLTVDPLLTTPAWTAEPDQAGAGFGTVLASAGDVNGDGFSDVAVGALSFDNGEADEGRVFLYLGSASGLSSTPSWTAESNQASAYFGSALAGVGDVNNDGFSDLVVGAYQFDVGRADVGRAFLYLGSATGLSAAPSWTAESNQTGAEFGSVVAGAGDVNGDGFSDVVVTAPRFDNGQADEGVAYLYLGGGSGLNSAPSWAIESNQVGATYGTAAATAGDVNADGFSDLVVGADGFDNGDTDEGRAFLYLGSATGLSLAPSWTAESNQAGAAFGSSLAGAGDVNGDGYSDLVVGAFRFDVGVPDVGRAFVYLGGPSGLSPTPSWTANPGGYFGSSVAGAGDVNGDGFSDVVVGAHVFENGQFAEGAAFLYLGSSAGLSATPAWNAESNQFSGGFGYSVAGAGDVNSDGFSDVVVGAPGFDNGEPGEGRAFLFLGSATGPAATAAWTAESNQLAAHFGLSIAGASDVNGDGFSDVVVGAPLFDNGETDEGRAFLYLGSASGLSATPAWTAESNQTGADFGSSVAGAGDVNGDGFSDVLVGARLFDNGENSEGRAFLFLGNSAGLSSIPSWTAESNQAGSRFGSSVSGAGDVNGDGFSDVAVGAREFSNGEPFEGRAFVYFGSAAGLSPTPSWTAESNQASAAFGSSVASAGDVNGDGFSDLLVGASLYDNGELDEGRAFLYLGGGGGLSPAPSWTAEANQAFASFGSSVASAGDVNGDGFSDAVIGAHAFDNGQVDEGRAFVYLGSAGGLSPTPGWTHESNQDSALFGASVAGAGDVNGDGFSDVAVGAREFSNGEPFEGRAFVYFGGAAGPSPTPSWTVESNQASAAFGSSVASAGDVNGDGFSDVAVGASSFDDGEADEGQISLFAGGDGAPGRTQGLVQRFAGRVLGPGARVALPGSLEGRFVNALTPLFPRLRLETEIKPVGTPFTDTGTNTSTLQRPGAVTSTTVAALPSGRYRWRARVLAGDQAGRWLHFGGNDDSQADFVLGGTGGGTGGGSTGGAAGGSAGGTAGGSAGGSGGGSAGGTGGAGGTSGSTGGGAGGEFILPEVDAATCGLPWTYAPSFLAADPTRWASPDAPEGLQIDENTGLLRWTPSRSQSGLHTVTLQVSAGGAVSRRLIEVLVRCSPRSFTVGCDCQAGGGERWFVGLLVVLLSRSRRPQRITSSGG